MGADKPAFSRSRGARRGNPPSAEFGWKPESFKALAGQLDEPGRSGTDVETLQELGARLALIRSAGNNARDCSRIRELQDILSAGMIAPEIDWR